MDIEAELSKLADGLRTALPQRFISRNLTPFDEQPMQEREAGRFTIFPTGVRYEPDEGLAQDEILLLTIMGEQTLPESAKGADIDAAEFSLLADLKQSLSIRGLPCLDILAVRQSAQLECPEAWIQADFELRETYRR